MQAKFVYLLIFTLMLVNNAAAQIKSIKPQHRDVAQSTSSGRWYILTSPDKDFLIEFPIKPEREADSEAPSGITRSYVLVKDSVLYQFYYVDTGLNPADYDANHLPQNFGRELVEHAKKKGSTVIRSQLLRINVFEYEVVSPRKGNRNLMLHWVERHVIRYGRQYTLSCGSSVPNQKVDVRICRRFFESFRVVRAPQPQ